MRLSVDEYRALPHKSITLLGMSGVGKTRLANVLRWGGSWFHYSVDYRIGTRYLDEAILDNIKSQAMQVPFLRELLLTDSIYISNNITFDNLKPLSSWLGMLGNPDLGGLPLEEFSRRQALHKEAEIAAMRDVPSFIDKSRSIYGYPHFLNDVSGSVCELDDDQLLQALAEQTLFIYLQADKKDEEHLINRAASDPKPLYYREEFLNEKLTEYKQLKSLQYATEIDPNDFVRWVFPHLFYSRIPRYESIAQKYGYTVKASDAFNVNTLAEFEELVESALAAHPAESD
ncbi:MAG: ATPase [Granulosicoccus sp.]|nr:ATPase [Granulosicoccus sp.]